MRYINNIKKIFSIVCIMIIAVFSFSYAANDTLESATEPATESATESNFNIDKAIVYAKLLEENTYDNILKKKSAISIKNILYLNDERRLEYDTYGDVRGVQFFKDWDYTKNNLYDMEPMYIKSTSGVWYETVDNEEIEPIHTLKDNLKGYYDINNPITTIWGEKTLVIPTNNYEMALDYKKGLGHILAKTNIKDLYKSYNQNVIYDFINQEDKENEITIDYAFALNTYIIDSINIRFKNENDNRRINIKIDYSPVFKDFLSRIVYDKDFILNYQKLIDANTEEALIYRRGFVSILDEKRKDDVIEKTLYLYKDKDGLLIIDDKGKKYTKDSVYEIDDKYLNFVFETDNIVIAFNNDIMKRSLVDDEGYRILSAFDNGEDRVLVMAKGIDETVEYTFDKNNYQISNIKKYSHANNKKTLIFNTDIIVGDNVKNAPHNITK